ncbi:hypothetical protein BGU88_19505, partial [Clostridioides difficile]
WCSRQGRGQGKAYRYQQRHCRHDRATSPSNLPWLGHGTLNSGFWGILAETTGRETQVSCSVGGDGITQKKQKSRALRGGDLRSKYYPVP